MKYLKDWFFGAFPLVWGYVIGLAICGNLARFGCTQPPVPPDTYLPYGIFALLVIYTFVFVVSLVLSRFPKGRKKHDNGQPDADGESGRQDAA